MPELQLTSIILVPGKEVWYQVNCVQAVHLIVETTLISVVFLCQTLFHIASLCPGV